ncbi:hypothetical protein ACFLXB_08440 [Chloroflexota bacterium]
MQTNSHQKLNRRKFLCLIIISALLWTGCNGIDLSTGSSDDSSADIPMLVDSSTSVWIEFPREGMILDMKSYTFVVYGADGVGVSSISMFLNSEPWPASQLSDLSGDESLSQVRVDQPWTAPYEGPFTLQAITSGKSGGVSTASEVHFCIVTCDPQTPPADGEVEITPTPTISTVALFDANPVSITAGACSNLSWTVTGATAVSLDNTPVNGSGTLQVCPCVSSSYQLKIDKADGSTEYLLAEVVVNGSCTAPATPTFTTAPPVATTSAPPADTSGPTISYTNLVFESCKVYGQAEISDPSGVGNAKFGYNLNNGGWLWVWMENIGGNMWQSEVGVVLGDGIGTVIGEIEYQIQSTDSLGNETLSIPATYYYYSCDG